MNDVLGMEIGQSVCHLVDVDRAASFGEGTVLCELFVKLALAGKFEHEKDALFVVEVAVEAEDVWMPEILLDFDLATDLLLHSGLDDLGLVETLEGEDIIWLDLGADHVHAAEFAFAQGTADVKVGEVPFSRGARSREEKVNNWSEREVGREVTNLETLESRASS
jgi:hypothetical protein